MRRQTRRLQTLDDVCRQFHPPGARRLRQEHAALDDRREAIDALMAPAIPARRGFFDECFRGPAHFSLGFMKSSETFRFGHPGAFGAPGAGGSMGYADPQAGIGYGYVTNRIGTHLEGDPRDVALRAAIPTSARRPSPAPRHSGAPQPHV